MRVYRVGLDLHDYLFFATTERGKVAETAGFIHNYALTYALTFNALPWPGLASRPGYRHVKQEQRYWQELGGLGMYVTPARMVSGSFTLTQYNTQWERYQAVTVQSAGYPNWGFIKSPRPGSTYRFYVLSEGDPLTFPSYVRLGKFMSKAKLNVEPAARVEPLPKRTLETEALLNWSDLAIKPVVFDLIADALPTRLVYNAVFSPGDGWRASFADGSHVVLPAGMGYLRS